MQLSKWAYHADFVVYPVLVGAAFLHALRHMAHGGGPWLAAIAVGLLTWTFIEYAVHRWVLHRVPPFRRLHAAHHARPHALIGTPTWLSAALFLGVWLVMAQTMAASKADGLAAGLMMGYTVYFVVHDAVHHRKARPGSWLHRTKERHALHHRPEAHGNFGVSTGLWDAVLGTGSGVRP